MRRGLRDLLPGANVHALVLLAALSGGPCGKAAG
jgi:hypothetical protein